MKPQIIETAGKLGIDPVWLDTLIRFETAGTYSPTIKNPSSSARGLIQVIDSTAKNVFNVSNSLELVNKYPDFDSQMEHVVYPYLKRYMPFNTKQSLYMSVFYPKYRYVSGNAVFPLYVRAVNKGINTPNDYIRLVDKQKPVSKAIPIVIIVAFGIFYYYQKKF